MYNEVVNLFSKQDLKNAIDHYVESATDCFSALMEFNNLSNWDRVKKLELDFSSLQRIVTDFYDGNNKFDLKNALVLLARFKNEINDSYMMYSKNPSRQFTEMNIAFIIAPHYSGMILAIEVINNILLLNGKNHLKLLVIDHRQIRGSFIKISYIDVLGEKPKVQTNVFKTGKDAYIVLANFGDIIPFTFSFSTDNVNWSKEEEFKINSFKHDINLYEVAFDLDKNKPTVRPMFSEDGMNNILSAFGKEIGVLSV